MTGYLRFDGDRATEADAEAHTPELTGQRAHLRSLLALRPGERVLDAGCGPGYLLEEMARETGPDGVLRGVDVSASMLDLARRRCGGDGRVGLEEGRCEELPFPDGSFDAVVSSQVLEYVEDVEGALAEFARVLRPGGRVVVLDTDWDSLVWHTRDRARMRHVLRLWDDHVADPRLPERLGPLLAGAGLREERLTTLTFVNRACHPGVYSHWQLGFVEAFLAGHPGADPETTRAWGDEQRELARTGRFFYSLGRYAFTAVRPAG
ncbi:methyltransferase domain-containing protein [Streptomyces sp. NPDC021100]|uniref:methyltransferase domain-containing protein n=1 Tax=Streptomyces sp. NPDC021100 TaxID=3365114 RepID=UPI0037AE6FD7